jgi:hypothetical protein
MRRGSQHDPEAARDRRFALQKPTAGRFRLLLAARTFRIPDLLGSVVARRAARRHKLGNESQRSGAFPTRGWQLFWRTAMQWIETRITELRQRCAGLLERRATLEAERARDIGAAAQVNEQIMRLDAELADLCRDIADAERKWAAR